MSTKQDKGRDPSPEIKREWLEALATARIETAAAAAGQRRNVEKYRRHADETQGMAAQAWTCMAEGEKAMAILSEVAVDRLQDMETHLRSAGWPGPVHGGATLREGDLIWWIDWEQQTKRPGRVLKVGRTDPRFGLQVTIHCDGEPTDRSVEASNVVPRNVAWIRASR